MADVHRFPDPLPEPEPAHPALKLAPTPLTLVFTDMVGSSAAKRAASLGADAHERDRAYLEGIQSKHLRLIRDAIADHNGKEIMTIGDSFFLTFADPVDAVRCAAAIQQRLRTHPIDTPSGPMQLRIGIHNGTPEYFENSWHGTDVDTAARAESAGSPQQIVVTDVARKLIGDPLGIKFRPLGTFTLKGVGEVKLWDADYDQHGLRTPSLRSNELKKRSRLIGVSIASLLILALLGFVGLQLWQKHKAQQEVAKSGTPSAKDSIILADFENKTGDPVFDTTLTQAFAIQMQQSPVLNLVSQQHIRQSMQYLGKQSTEALTPAIVREVAQREGIKAYLTGNIAKFGNEYVISVTAQNTNTGDDIASVQAQAPDKEHVIDAIGTVATSMRARLGESLSSIQKLDTPMGQATTPSLEAFRAYALGDVEHEKGLDIPQAEGHYRQAVEIDPNFAMAWARLGVVYGNSGQRGRSLDCYGKAYALSKNVSERERLYIQAHYFLNAIGNVQKAIDTLELAVRTYPLDISNWINLGSAQSNIGLINEAIENTKRSLTLDPTDGVAFLNLASMQVSIDRFSDAAQTLAEADRQHADSGTGSLTAFYQLAFLTGDRAAMAKAAAKVEGRVDQYQMSQSIAAAQEFAGQYREASQSWNLAATQAATQKATDAQASSLLLRVSGRGFAGMCENSARDIKAALALDKTKPTLVSATISAGICNQPAIALPLIESLVKQYPEDTQINQIVAPQTRAALALAANQPQEALTALEGAKAFDLVSPGAYLQGLAYLDLKDSANAIEAFQRATKYKGAALSLLQDYGQAQLGLARAYTMAGNKPEAKKAYEALFVTWKDADTDLPQLLAAKKEYATL